MTFTVTELISLATGIGVLFGLIIQFRKYNSDAYKSLLDALATSGQTIEDLMKMIASLPALRAELTVALGKIVMLEAEAVVWKRERKEWTFGIARILAQLVGLNQRPDWLPHGITIEEVAGEGDRPPTIRITGNIPGSGDE